jgi:hypothetical protein
MAMSSRPRAVLAMSFVFGGLLVLLGSSPSHANPEHDTRLAAPSCNDDCNRKASDCLDGCEEKFKGDDKARVTCKFECANKRQACEKDCG